jgi:threonylcarbamoyladenosine tRNA methylthiotransferase MtaB
MNRQYTRADYLRMLDRVHDSFDRPAITTDIIVGFPGESDDEFARTLEVVDRARFIHIHAFPFSSRPGTAAARWSEEFIPAPIAQARIKELTARAAACGFAFRSQFAGHDLEILIERVRDLSSSLRHGRCERWFDVHVDDASLQPGDAVRVRIDRVTFTRTFGSVRSRSA